jgi:hypothetical protein
LQRLDELNLNLAAKYDGMAVPVIRCKMSFMHRISYCNPDSLFCRVELCCTKYMINNSKLCISCFSPYDSRILCSFIQSLQLEIQLCATLPSQWLLRQKVSNLLPIIIFFFTCSINVRVVNLCLQTLVGKSCAFFLKLSPAA